MPNLKSLRRPAAIIAPSDRSNSIPVGDPRPIESFSRNRMWSRLVACLVAATFLSHSAASSWSQVACKPLLSVRHAQDVRPSFVPVPWRWNATVVADTRHCATRSGNFEIDFVRIKENSPDLQFTEKFRWAQNQFDVSMDLTPGEAILEFRIGFIAPCVCRDINNLSSDLRTK